jgi:arabinofuranan 3-O-arabinosyltransferase
VVRNDLRYDAQVTPTLAVHESLAESGIQRVASFGPATGSTIEQPDATLDGHTRLPYPSVEIYDVGGTSPGRLVPESRLVNVRGAAEDVPAVLTALGGDRDAVISSDAAGRLDGLPLIQTDGLQRREVSDGKNPSGVPATDQQPSALVFRNQQIGRSACLHVVTRPVCWQSVAKDSEEPTGLLRSVELPQAASYQLHGTALPKDGATLEGMLVVPGAITASASSRAVTAPEGRPGAAVDRDLGTGWVADPGDPAPSLTLKLPAARELSGLQFLSDPYLTASRPTTVLLRFDGGAPTRSTVDPEGYVRFAERKARTVDVDFAETRPMVDFDSATGSAQTAPVGVADVRVLGADDLRKALDLNSQTGVYCGNGPRVRVDGVPAGTELKATVRDLLQRRPVAFSTCGKDSTVPLHAGRNNVDVLAGGGFVPIETTLTKAGFGNVAATPVQDVDVWRPNPAKLTAEVPAADEQSVLTVAQNYNDGWEAYDGTGHKLTPIRVGGWQQGWVLPAGPEHMVTASFMPDRTYRGGLLIGLLALLSVIAMAVFFRRRSRRPGHRLREGRSVGPWVALALGAVAGTVMSGWIGLAAVAVAAVCSWFLPRRVVLTVVAAVVTLGTLVAAVQPWPDGDAGVTSGVVQSSILFGCALALLSTFTGETSYDLSRLPRRMMGRSIQ